MITQDQKEKVIDVARSMNCEPDMNTLQFVHGLFFLCKVTSLDQRNKGKIFLLVYNDGQTNLYTVQEFHIIRRYTDIYSDDFRG